MRLRGAAGFREIAINRAEQRHVVFWAVGQYVAIRGAGERAEPPRRLGITGGQAFEGIVQVRIVALAAGTFDEVIEALRIGLAFAKRESAKVPSAVGGSAEELRRPNADARQVAFDRGV